MNAKVRLQNIVAALKKRTAKPEDDHIYFWEDNGEGRPSILDGQEMPREEAERRIDEAMKRHRGSGRIRFVQIVRASRPTGEDE